MPPPGTKDDDDAAARLAGRAEELVIGRRWREACDVVRAGEAIASDRPHRSKALFGAIGDAAAMGAAAEAALASTQDRLGPAFPGFERGRVLVVDPTGEDSHLTPQDEQEEGGGGRGGRRPRTKIAGGGGGGGGAFATVAAALGAAADGDVLLLRPGTHHVTRSRDGEGLSIDKRVMITGSSSAGNPSAARAARARLYHCGNAPALRLRRPCVLRALAVETDGFREAVLLEAGSEVMGRERLRQHARLGAPLALLWGCSVRSGGDDAAHVVAVGNGAAGGAGAGGGAGGVGAGAGGGDGDQPPCRCDDALLVGCELSAPSEGKSALVVVQGARVRAARGCSLGPCGGSGAAVLGPRSALWLEGPGTAVAECAGDGVAVSAGGALSIPGGGGVAVRHCGGAAVDASGEGSSVSIGGNDGGGGGGGGGGSGGRADARLGEGCRGGALMLWDGATAEVSASRDNVGATELLGGEGGSGAFAVVVGPSVGGGGGGGGGGGAVVSCRGGDGSKGGGVGIIIRGDAFVAGGASSESTVQALLRLGATRVVASDAASAEDRARLPEPGAAAGGRGAFCPPPEKARFAPLSFA